MVARARRKLYFLSHQSSSNQSGQCPKMEIKRLLILFEILATHFPKEIQMPKTHMRICSARLVTNIFLNAL